MMFSGLSQHTDLRDQMVKASGIDSFRAIVSEMRIRRKDVAPEDKLGWYLRYWKKHPPQFYLKGISVVE